MSKFCFDDTQTSGIWWSTNVSIRDLCVELKDDTSCGDNDIVELLRSIAKSIDLNEVLRLQSKLKGSENFIRNSTQPKLWLEIHLLGMLADEISEENKRKSQSFITTNVSNDSNIETINHRPEIIDSNTKQELSKAISTQEELQESANINLDKTWKKVLSMLELPSTKMLLSQQAKLIKLNSDSAEIEISEKWINMIQSRKKIIEDAFYKARGASTKVHLIEQKDTLYNLRKEAKNPQRIEQKNEFKADKDLNNNNSREKKEKVHTTNLEKSSIDQKAKQFADFFNGEIVDLE